MALLPDYPWFSHLVVEALQVSLATKEEASDFLQHKTEEEIQLAKELIKSYWGCGKLDDAAYEAFGREFAEIIHNYPFHAICYYDILYDDDFLAQEHVGEDDIDAWISDEISIIIAAGFLCRANGHSVYPVCEEMPEFHVFSREYGIYRKLNISINSKETKEKAA